MSPRSGRIPVVDVQPTVDCGRFPAKAVVGETFTVSATVFREGHDAVAAAVVLAPVEARGARKPRTPPPLVRMRLVEPGFDRWAADVTPDAEGDWTFHVEAWDDPLGSWRHAAEIKVPAGLDVELVLEEGARVFERAAKGAPKGPARDLLSDVVRALRDTSRPPEVRLDAALASDVQALVEQYPVRDLVTRSAKLPVQVDRERALYGSWYEFFPRSEGAIPPMSGTLSTASHRLPAVAAMGFDVVYLPPVHPIGRSFRKGPNNMLTPGETDPGVPWAIGSAEGGHDAIHPELGTIDDFDAFVARARELGMEIALDLALQCSPDHPWVTEHPEWFTTRADGTIAYAENPPKKYQDIYPVNFDNDPAGIYAEVRRVIQVWIDHGVTAFRVDNPHTKPLEFWEWLLADVRAAHPDVLFLAEAFTRPAMMQTLARIGFHQSYTYFTWRNTKKELAEYLTEVSGEDGSFMRPSFWPTTHDILPPYLQDGGTAGFAVRAVLAATGSPTWGIYSGYELVENVPRPGVEEQIDNEKYELKPRDWARADVLGIRTLLTRLNEIRREHPALQQLRDLRVHRTSDDALLCFSRHLAAEHSPTGRADTVVVVVNLDPHATHEGTVHLDLAALGVAPTGVDGEALFAAHDELSGHTYAWGSEPFVSLDPQVQVAHVIHVRNP